MNNDMHTASRPGDDDPWQDLAEELFGVECGKEHKTEESMDSAMSEPPRAAAHESPPVAREPEPVAARHEPELAFDADDTDEDDADAEDEFEFGEELTAETEPAATETETAEEPAAAGADQGDTFWDALADWSWDESSERAARSSEAQQERKPDRGPRGGGHGRRDESRGRRDSSRGRGDEPKRRESGSDRPARAHSSSAPRPSRAAAPPADDFGTGLLGEEPPTTANYPSEEPPSRFEDVEQTADAFAEEESFATDLNVREESSEPAGDEAGGDRKRRRRRRRGGSGRNGPAETAAADTSTVQESESAPTGFEVAADETDDFGPANVSEEPVESTTEDPAGESNAETRRPSRRRRSRGRGRRGEGSAPAASEASLPAEKVPVSETIESVAEEDDDEDAEEDDGAIDHVANYANVPTWEEAISYLLRPSTVQVDPASAPAAGKRAPAPGEPKKPTRHYGHRRS